MARRATDIPDDVYVQFVRSLFESRIMLLIGAFSHMLVALMAYLRTERPLFAILSVLFLAVGFWRFSGLRPTEEDLDKLDVETARKWEASYVVKGGFQGLLLGLFAFSSVFLYPDQFAELGALAINLASLVTVVGRNYGSARMVVIFTTTMMAPIMAGLLLRAELPYVVLGLLVLPFGYIVVRSAEEVRNILARAVEEGRKADELARRFDRALNTMSHGLVMFSPQGRVVVANAQAAEFLSFQSSQQLLGRTLDALLMRGLAGNMLSPKDFDYARAQLRRALSKGRGRKVLLALTDGRYIEFSAREGREELRVLTFEEVTQRVEAEAKIRHMARYDSLTNLPNRAYFQELVREFMAAGDESRLCALAVMDLDDFKTINDTLGHPVGDGLIYAVAERLAEFESGSVKVGRFGGDEFMVYFDRVEDETDFANQFNVIFSALQGEVDIAGHLLRIQASGGAVVVPVRDGDLDMITVKADLALYNAKEQGKNCWRLFEADMDAAFRSRQIMKSELRSAIQSRNLRVVYQPIVDVRTMRISDCEALCRWDHPDLGPVSPAIFIPLAEEMGLISEISAFVLEAACQECMNWPQHIGVSVNLSAKDFQSGAVIDKVRETLNKSGIAPERLEIEVTETALLYDKDATRLYIEGLKELGIRIALDDFGTGYSSLSYLHTLPLDRVKIDSSFLHDVTKNPRSHKLLKSVVQLSRGLGLDVTVEGVETFQQLKLLETSVKPDRVQGFLFGSALSASGIKTMSDVVWYAEDGNIRRDKSLQH